jgi:TP901 family phage tail tape measure protein
MAEKIDELYVEIKAKTDKLEAEFNSLTNKMNKKGITLKAKFDTAVAKMKISELQALHTKLKAEFQKKLSMNVDAASLDRTRTKLASVESALKGVSSELPKTGGFFSSTFAKIATGAAAFMMVRQFVMNAVESFKNLDTGMRNVNTIIKVGKDELNAYKSQILNLRRETGQTTKELTDGFYELVSAGVKAGDSMKFLGVATKTAVAGLTTTDTAVDGLTTVINAWGLSSDDAGKIADIMFKSVEIGKTTFEEIASSISMVAPLASAVGVSFEEVAGAIANMTAQGTPTSVAMTQIAAAITGLNRNLGDGWSKTMTLQEAMQEMFRRTKGSATELEKALGRKEGVLAVLANAGANAEKAGEALEEMGRAGGSTMSAFKEQTKSLEFKTKTLTAAFDTLAVSAIGAFAEPLSWLLTNIAGGLDVITGKAKKMRDEVLKQSAGGADTQSVWVTSYAKKEGSSDVEYLQFLNKELDIAKRKWRELDSEKQSLGKSKELYMKEENAVKRFEELGLEMIRIDTQAKAIQSSIKGIGKSAIETNTDVKPISKTLDELKTELEKLQTSKGLLSENDTQGIAKVNKEIAALTKKIEALENLGIKASGAMSKLKKQMDELQKLDPVNDKGWADLNRKIKEVQEGMERLQSLGQNITIGGRTSRFRENITPYMIEADAQTSKVQMAALQGYKAESKGQKNEAISKATEELPMLYDELRNQLVGGLGEVSSIITDMLGGSESAAGRIVNTFSRAVNTVNQIYNLFMSIKATIEAIETAKSIVDIGKAAIGLSGGGSFMVPAGFSRDNFPLMPGISAQSGELITVTPKGQVSSQLKMNTQLLNAVNGLARNMAINGRPIININTEADWLKVTQQKITPAQTLNSRTRSNELNRL